jgi:hypothetical protein
LFDERRERLHEERARLSQIERLVRQAEEAWSETLEQAKTVRRLSEEIDDSYARQEELRRVGRDAIARFSATFDYVVRAILVSWQMFRTCSQRIRRAIREDSFAPQRASFCLPESPHHNQAPVADRTIIQGVP